jgi:hypothetical protein
VFQQHGACAGVNMRFNKMLDRCAKTKTFSDPYAFTKIVPALYRIARTMSPGYAKAKPILDSVVTAVFGSPLFFVGGFELLTASDRGIGACTWSGCIRAAETRSGWMAHSRHVCGSAHGARGCVGMKDDDFIFMVPVFFVLVQFQAHFKYNCLFNLHETELRVVDSNNLYN